MHVILLSLKTLVYTICYFMYFEYVFERNVLRQEFRKRTSVDGSHIIFNSTFLVNEIAKFKLLSLCGNKCCCLFSHSIMLANLAIIQLNSLQSFKGTGNCIAAAIQFSEVLSLFV